MLGKKNLFKLDISGLEFWQKVQDDESKDFQEVYRKQVCLEGTLILDRMKKAKDGSEYCRYIDLVTGRVIFIRTLEDGDTLVIYPSGVIVSKDRLKSYEGDAYKEVSEILDDDKRLSEYEKVSEEVLYDSYFCEGISKSDDLTEIPVTVVEEAIAEKRKSVFGSGQMLVKNME